MAAPKRPASVSPGAQLENEQWVETPPEEGGTFRAWSSDGEPVAEIEFQKGLRRGRALELAQDGVYERGYFHDDYAVDQWTLLSGTGEELWSADLGLKLDTPVLLASSVFLDARKESAHWESLAAGALESRRVAEAALAMARAAAAAHSVEKLDAFLRERCIPRPAEFAEEVAAALAPSEGLLMGPAVNAMLRGASATKVLQAVAIFLDQGSYSRAALDFINAAILLSPDRLELLFTRGLVLMSLGLDEQARHDANSLAAAEPEQAEFLLHYLDALFPTFDFWPAAEKPATTYDALPDKPDRTVAEVKALAQKYALRLDLVRGELLSRVKPDVRWMLPEVTALLKGAKVALERTTFTKAQDGGEEVEVAIDESIDVDGWDIPRLMRMARDEWSCLTWLCWACGQTKVALPIKVAAPKEFGQAAGMSQQRLWRTRDLRLMGQHQVDSISFTWEGMSIEELPQPLAHIAEGQYEDLQALFMWLTDKGVRSPWQDDLRGS